MPRWWISKWMGKSQRIQRNGWILTSWRNLDDVQRISTKVANFLQQWELYRWKICYLYSYPFADQAALCRECPSVSLAASTLTHSFWVDDGKISDVRMFPECGGMPWTWMSDHSLTLSDGLPWQGGRASWDKTLILQQPWNIVLKWWRNSLDCTISGLLNRAS